MIRNILALTATVFATLLVAPAIASAQMPGAAAAPRLSLEDAKRVLDAAEAEARANQWNVTIVITDAAGVPVYLRRLDNAAPRSFDIALAKARTSVATGLTTIEYGQRVQAGTIEAVPEGITFEGGLPIRVGGELVGGIGTSGVRANEDAQISRAGLAAIGAE
jgi:glc operon protein GlcG